MTRCVYKRPYALKLVSIPTPEQINAYEAAPTHIAVAIKGPSEAQMHHLLGTGEWSIHEVVVHLGDSEATGTWRYSPGTDRTAQDVVRLSRVPIAFSGLKTAYRRHL